jgi:transposase
MALVGACPTIRGKPGRPLIRPKSLYADRAYHSEMHRILLWNQGIATHIARRGQPHGSGLGKVRWVVERTLSWLHQYRRLRIRFERRADIHEAFLTLGCALICWKTLQTGF